VLVVVVAVLEEIVIVHFVTALPNIIPQAVAVLEEIILVALVPKVVVVVKELKNSVTPSQDRLLVGQAGAEAQVALAQLLVAQQDSTFTLSKG
jgi:hypothetical protein